MYLVNKKQLEMIDPKTLGLNGRTMVGKTNDNFYYLVKDRKSRIIMKDGKQILDQIEMVKKNSNAQKVVLVTNAPICSKTTKYFKTKKVKVFDLEKING